MNIKKDPWDEFDDAATVATAQSDDPWGEFEDVQPAQPAAQPVGESSPTRGVESAGVAGKIFPRSTVATDRGAGFGQKVLAAAGDVLSLPQRGVSALATGAGTLAGGGSLKQAAKEAYSDVGQFATEEKGALGLAQSAAYDPTLLVPGVAGIKAAKAVSKIPMIGKLAKASGVGKIGTGAIIGSTQGALSSGIQESTSDDVNYANVALATAMGVAIPGAVGAAGKLAGKAIGGKLEGIGRKFLMGDEKIPKTIAKTSYGKTLAEKQQTIADDIVEFGLTKDNYANESSRAVNMAKERFDEVEKVVREISDNPALKKINPENAAFEGINYKDFASIGDEPKYAAIVQKIRDGFKSRGLDKEATLDKLIEAKRQLDPQGNIFKRGLETGIDPMESDIRKRMYYNLVNAIGEVSPETKALNTEAKRLLDASKALESAAVRTANKDAIGLTDWIQGSASTVAALSSPGSLFFTLPVMGAKMAAKGGKISRSMVNLGRAMQGKGDRSMEGTLKGFKGLKEAREAQADAMYEVPAYERKGIDPEAMQRSIESKKIPYVERGRIGAQPTEEQLQRAEQLAKQSGPYTGPGTFKGLNPTASAFERVPDLEQRAVASAEKLLQGIKGTPLSDAATAQSARQFLAMKSGKKMGLDYTKTLSDKDVISYARQMGFQQ